MRHDSLAQIALALMLLFGAVLSVAMVLAMITLLVLTVIWMVLVVAVGAVP